MAYSWSVNNRPLTGSKAMYSILQNFCTGAGWNLLQSSDGSSTISTATFPGIFTNGGASGANGMANNYAWFRIQDPAAGREFVVQRGTTNWWGIKYSVASHFILGSPTPSATQVPAATDEVALLGNITSTNATYAALWVTGDGTYNLHMCMGDSSIGYGFWIWAMQNASANGSASGWMMDVLTGYDTGDLDPSCHYVYSGAYAYDYLSQYSKAFYISISAAHFVQVVPGIWAYGYNGSSCGSNAWNCYEDVLPIFWVGNTIASYGWKGWSSLLKTCTSINTVHNHGDIIGVGSPPTLSTKNYVHVGGGLLLPWPSGTDCVK